MTVTKDKKVFGKSSPSLETRLMSLAVQASWISKDPHEQIGAIIINSKNRPIAVGWNDKPESITSDKDLSYSLEDKKIWMNVAALNAANLVPRPIESHPQHKMILTHMPCLESVRAAASVRANEIIYGPLIPDWYTGSNFQEVEAFAKLNNITLSKFDGNLNWARDKWEAFSEML